MKDALAERLAQAHYRIDPSLSVVRRLMATPELEADPEEPIKLLEVSDATTADGIIPVYFGPHLKSGMIYPSLIVEITPSEYQDILRDSFTLPHGWQLGEILEKAALPIF
jgi:hypothetical protein